MTRQSASMVPSAQGVLTAYMILQLRCYTVRGSLPARGPQPEQCTSQDRRCCLEIILIVTTGGTGTCHWHLVGGGQGCWSTSATCGTAPNMNDLAQEAKSAKVEKPCSRPVVLKLWCTSDAADSELTETQVTGSHPPGVPDSAGLGGPENLSL